MLGSQTCFNQHTCRRFVVLGSTGSKYHVVLADDKPSCQCMDFRIRRRECKHIKLVLQQLGISSSPADWHQASLLRTPLYWTITRLCELHCHDELPSMYAAPCALVVIWAVVRSRHVIVTVQAVDKQLAAAAASEGKGGDAYAAGGAGVTDARTADGAEAVAEPITKQESGKRKGGKPAASKASKRPKAAEPDASKGGRKNARTTGASADSPTKPGTRRLPDRLK